MTLNWAALTQVYIGECEATASEIRLAADFRDGKTILVKSAVDNVVPSHLLLQILHLL